MSGAPDAAPGSADWFSGLLRASFGASFWIFLAFAFTAGAVVYALLGHDLFVTTIVDDLELLTDTVPRVAAAQMLAGFVWIMLPRERCIELVGPGSGRRGLFLAAVAGVITPGGPASAFSLLAIFAGAGADRGVLVTYITSWAMLALQRIIVWDLPFMGWEFSATRFVICLPLPIIAGSIARNLPLELKLAAPGEAREDAK